LGSSAEFEETLLLSAAQLKRPYAAYGGLGNVLSVCGKRLVCNSDNRLHQATWQHVGDSGEVGAVVLTPCARFVAVGTTCPFQLEAGCPDKLAFMGSVSVLNAATGHMVSVLSSSVVGGVHAADFAHDGKMLACLGGDLRHMLLVFSSCSGAWADPVLQYSGECSTLNPTCLTFLSGGSGAFHFATGGACTLKLWTLQGRNASFVAVEEPMTAAREAENKKTVAALTCMLGLPGAGHLLVGDEDGAVGVFCDGSQTRTALAQHTGAVSALTTFSRGGQVVGFVSGAQDGIKVWSLFASSESAWATELYSFSADALYASLANAAPIAKMLKFAGGESVFPTHISSDAVGQRMLVGLSVNAVVEISVDSGSVLVVAEGQLPRVRTTHVLAHPTEPHTLVTAQSNNTIKVWDLSLGARECVSLLTLTHTADGLCFLSDTLLAVGISKGDTGGQSGGILFLELSPAAPAAAPAQSQAAGKVQRGLYRTLKVLSRFHNIGKGAINSLRVRGDGRYLAAGSEDGNVYLYPTDTSSTLLGTLAVTPGVPVQSMDFSADGRYLRVFGPTPKGDTIVRSSYFDFEDKEEGEAASLVTQEDLLPALKAVRWATCSSPAALEARCVHAAAKGGAPTGQPSNVAFEARPQTTSVCASGGGELIVAGYSDGSTQIFR